MGTVSGGPGDTLSHCTQKVAVIPCLRVGESLPGRSHCPAGAPPIALGMVGAGSFMYKHLFHTDTYTWEVSSAAPQPLGPAPETESHCTAPAAHSTQGFHIRHEEQLLPKAPKLCALHTHFLSSLSQLSTGSPMANHTL